MTKLTIIILFLLCLPSIISGHCLSLKEAVEIALDQNPANRAAGYGIRAADAAVGVAEAPYYPTYMFYADFSRFKQHIFLPRDFFPDLIQDQSLPTTVGPENDYNIFIYGRFTLFDSGRRRAQVQRALAQKGEAIEEGHRVKQQIVLNVYSAFYELLANMEIEQVAIEQEKRSADHLKIVHQRKEAGDVPQADVYRSEVELANASQTIARAKTEVTIAKGKLNIAMGIPPQACVEVCRETPPIKEPLDCQLEEAIQKAVTLRPELNASWQRILALSSQYREVQSEYGPRVAAYGAYGRHDNRFPPKDEEWRVGVNVEWPIFEGFSTTYNLQRVRALIRQEQAEFDRVYLQVQREVWDAFARLKAAYSLINTIQTQIKSARETLRLSELRYQIGAGTLTEMLDAQTALTQAEADYVEAHWSYLMALASFRWSQGLF